jgi:hypothetical protein
MEEVRVMDLPDGEATTDDLQGLRWLYAELLRMETHWTDQVQNQQQRISTLLTVTGILLGFLAGAGFLTGTLSEPVRRWPADVYIFSLISLCAALFLGIRALRPSIPIAGTTLNAAPAKKRPLLLVATMDLVRCFKPSSRFHPGEMPLWLDAEKVRGSADTRSAQALLRELCDSAAENRRKANHQGAMLTRRLLMYRQFSFLLLSLALLIAALVGFIMTGGVSQ